MQFNIPAEFKNASGVYIIRNTVNSKVYVGSAKDFQNRYKGHSSHLRRGKHHSKHLQRHYEKYGASCLTFNLLELTDSAPEKLVEAENRHLLAFDAGNPEKGFNNMPASFPARHSEETKARLKKLLTSYMTPEVLARRKAGQLAAAAKKTEARMARRATCLFCGEEFMPPLWKSIGKAKFCSHECSTKYPVSEETKAKQRAKSTGRKMSSESIEKSRQKRIGKGDRRSSEGKERQRLAVTGREKSEEQKEKERERLKRPDVVAKRIAALKAKGPWNKSPEPERQRTCQYCGGVFLAEYPKKIILFCSRSCYYKGRPPMSEEQKQALSKTVSKLHTPEAIAKRARAHSEARIGKPYTQERLEKVRATRARNKAAKSADNGQLALL